MLVQQRYDRILEILEEVHSVRVSELVEEFGVSVETVRRDLEYLESIGKLKRVHGGAILEIDNSKEETFTKRETLNIEKKKEIGEIATRFVKENMVIAMDVSTTNTEFAKALKKKFKSLTIITNSLPIAYELSEMPQYTIILIGGMLRNQELCVVGEMAEKFLEPFHIDRLFLSMSGISLYAGLTDYGVGEWNIKKKMLAQANSCYVLADSTKFDAVSMLKVCSFDQINGIITDSGLSEKIKQKYEEKNIMIINS
ncbi:DeoR/GlpR family DNA-binding transcription regulator [Bacillus sp. FJAT-47783]|uniref:DeoR/GlpR family DNA-binding transcription regulator n=1 Tax=Bacillus sp. FJAT-47783 TaxID=2922712 RepID=UPI001FAC3B60|nr:DeoR/GlpR family DNA-binding transcription regulator [Bacillus sp. FJAT-47783]